MAPREPKKKGRGGGRPSVESYVQNLKAFGGALNEAVKQHTGKPISIHASELLHNIATGLKDKAEGRKPGVAVHDPFQVLGVTREDDQNKVREAYLALTKLYHEAGPLANEDKWREINVAYQKICDLKGWKK